MAIRCGPVRSSASAESAPGWRPEDVLRFETNFLEQGVVQGVYDELEVTENSGGANMTVEVAAGLALIEYTSTHLSPNTTIKTWLRNSAAVELNVPTADSTHPRKDRVIAEIQSIDPNGSASDNGRFRLIEGTPAASPSAPAQPANCRTLAIIDVPASDTAITDDQITDNRAFVTLQADVLADIVRTADLASTDTGKGASMVGVEDDAENFDGETVEEVLEELQGNIDAAASLIGNTVKVVYLSGTNTAAVGASSTSEVDIPTHQYTIPANDLVADVGYEFDYGLVVTESGSGATALTIRLKLGSTTLLTWAHSIDDPSQNFRVFGRIQGTAAAGASVSVKANGNSHTTYLNVNLLALGAASVATNGSLDLKLSIQFGASNAGNTVISHTAAIKKISSSVF